MIELSDHQQAFAGTLAHVAGLHPDVAVAYTATVTLPNGSLAHPSATGPAELQARRLGHQIARDLTPGPHQPVTQLRMLADHPGIPGGWEPLRKALRARVMATGGAPVTPPPPPPRLLPAVLGELRAARAAKKARR